MVMDLSVHLPLWNKFKKRKELKGSTEGITSILYRLDSALARQVFYTTTRLGIYKTITANVKESNKKQGISKSYNNFRGFNIFPKSLLCIFRRVRRIFSRKPRWFSIDQNASRFEIAIGLKKKLFKCFQCIFKNYKRIRIFSPLERCNTNSNQSSRSQFSNALFIRWSKGTNYGKNEQSLNIKH